MNTLRTLLDDYLTRLLALRFSIHTVTSLKYQIRRFLTYLEEAFRLTDPLDLLKSHLTSYQEKLARHTTEKGLPLSTGAINRQIIAVKGFLKYLSQNGFVLEELADALFYLKKPLSLPASVLSHSRMKRLLALTPSDSSAGFRNRALFELLYSCGLRVNETSLLDLSSVDFKNHTVLVTGKGGKQRVAPVGQTAMKYLLGYVRAVRPYLVKDPSEKALFLNRMGKRLSVHGIQELVRECSKRLKSEIPVTPHTFRRSCATELIRGGANLYHVKEMLGHESLDTLKHYVRLTIVDLKKTHKKCHPREHGEDL